MVSPFRSTSWYASLAFAMLLLSAGCSSSSQSTLPPEANDPNVVAVYGDEVLTLEELERRYAQSQGTRTAARADSVEDYLDFLERYVDFRLKVAAAEEAGISDDSEVREEIRTYRSRLARPFLLDREVLDPIIQELYARRQQIVDVSHILVRVPEDADPADTLAAYQKLTAVRDSVLQGADFGDLALRHSEDPSAAADPNQRGYRGRLGYFTGGNLVEPFETFAYETPVGEVSPVFRTQFGYHVLKVHDRRPAVPDVRASHIMLQPGPTPEDSAAAREQMAELKAALDEGASFAELAREHSQDMQSRPRGGDLGMVSFTASLPPEFKDALFSLDEIGEVSDVVETVYGLHLISMTERAELPTYEASYNELKTLANRLPRTRRAEAELARQILSQRDGRVDTARVVGAFAGLPADSVVASLIDGRLSDDVLGDTFFVLGDTSFTIGDLSEAARGVRPPADATTESVVREVVSSFVTNAAIDVEADRLEDRDPEFRRLMAEFRDGLILFELMEDSVWTAAEQDSAGLRAYYDAHADSYRWPDRTRIISVQSPSDSLIQIVASRLEGGEPVRSIYDSLADDTLLTIRLDTTLIADSTFSIYDRALALPIGARTEVLPHRGSFLVMINDGVEPARRKTFEEARAEVVSSYQQIVEERLVSRLRERYNARTFPERLAQAFQAGPGSGAINTAADD